MKKVLVFVLLLVLGAGVYTTDWAMYSYSGRMDILRSASVDVVEGCYYVNAPLTLRELKALHTQRNKLGGIIVYSY
jgi:hypothetical protein